MDSSDRRNVVDEFKGVPIQSIIEQLDARGVELEVAIENLERDFNMGTIVRSANAFGVRRVHVVGRRQWNKRGAMATDKYLHVHYYGSVQEFVTTMCERGRRIVAIDIVDNSMPIQNIEKQTNDVLVFGAEGPGISRELQLAASMVVHIPQLGSTRSLNVGVAAGIALWEWTKLQ